MQSLLAKAIFHGDIRMKVPIAIWSAILLFQILSRVMAIVTP